MSRRDETGGNYTKGLTDTAIDLIPPLLQIAYVF